MGGLLRSIAAGCAALALAFASGAAAAPGDAWLTPSATHYRLHAGDARTLAHTFTLQGRAAEPLDIYFLVDATPAMLKWMKPVRAGLGDVLRRLEAHGGDLRAGLGEFRSTGSGDWLAGLTYRRLSPLAPVASSRPAFDRLGRDESIYPSLVAGHDAHTISLEQAVRGDGHEPYVAAGHQAGFRPGVRKIVVLVTDESFVTNGDEPSRAQAIATLKGAGVSVVGIAMRPAAVADLTAVAQGTGSTARHDVDCGASKVRAGRAAACVVYPNYIGRVIDQFVQPRAHLTFAVTGSGSRRLDAPARWVDRARSHRIPLSMRLACGRHEAGAKHLITVSARLDGVVVAQARVALECVARD